MSAPTPAQPSEGAVICLRNEVPVGWEYRYTPDDEWNEKRYEGAGSRDYVEARPKPEPLVAVMLPKVMVEYGAAGCGMRYEEKRTFFEACRAALESDS